MQNKMSTLVIFLFFTVLHQINGYQSYGGKIPNGGKVPHPCKSNTIWHGVGHLSQTGGGKRNPFGQDFSAASHKWTTTLCKKDSDKDGRTNGEELGDPNCLWKETMPDPPAPNKTGITHPGVCEPVESQKCNFQTWVSCSGMKQKCAAMNETGVLTKDIRFPRTNLQPRETTYFCHISKLPDDQAYHIVGTEPIIDNSMVIHHMILSGCTEDMSSSKEPYTCIMGNAKCQEPLGGWTVGAEGQCFPRAAGFRFGKNASRYVQLQVHWTNEKKRSDLYDSSGIKIYYTPKLRPHDLGVIATGQMHLEIPPNTKQVVQKGTCPSSCMQQMLKKPVNISSTLVHAHFLGKNLSLAQYRNGKFVRWLAQDDAFSYNNPIQNIFNPPIVLNPEDELRTTCVFDSTGKKKWTYYGDGTYEEMCFAFVNYYPKLKNSMKESLCINFERYTFCDFVRGNVTLRNHNVGQCNLTEFDSHLYMQKIIRNCPIDAKVCRPGCKFYLKKMDSHRCMKGFMRKAYDYGLYQASNVTAITLFKARSLCEYVKLQPSATYKRKETAWMIYGAIVLCLLKLGFIKH